MDKWLHHYINCKKRGGRAITYPFPNFNDACAEVWKWWTVSSTFHWEYDFSSVLVSKLIHFAIWAPAEVFCQFKGNHRMKTIYDDRWATYETWPFCGTFEKNPCYHQNTSRFNLKVPQHLVRSRFFDRSLEQCNTNLRRVRESEKILWWAAIHQDHALLAPWRGHMSLRVSCHIHQALQWCHNGRTGVSNHQPHHCLLNFLFRSRPKRTSKLRVTGLLRGIHRWPMNSPHKWTVTRKMFPSDDVIKKSSNT